MEPRYAKRAGTSKLDLFAEKLSQWLKAEQSKGRKQQRTLLKMHADLVALGLDGSYGRVAAFARDWRQRQHEAQRTTGRGSLVPLVFSPGGAFQFDWSEDWAVIGGERVTLQMAHTKLSHSRAFHLRACPLQTHEMLFDARNHAFRVPGGVPRRGLYDSMKTAVDRMGTGMARDINQRFAALCSHYCSSRSSATRLRPGRGGRWRRTCAMRGIGCGSRHHASRAWTSSTTGWSCVARR